ncbi:hypothetical protein VNO78_08696 [Psophocarpus tetragonolobus]|uniref:Uncharacterized protein n=1 Tax=Psophocarpus tetragonolobus TaxID=3891 RepID=A0AAN9SXK4_PSOTE
MGCEIHSCIAQPGVVAGLEKQQTFQIAFLWQLRFRQKNFFLHQLLFLRVNKLQVPLISLLLLLTCFIAFLILDPHLAVMLPNTALFCSPLNFLSSFLILIKNRSPVCIHCFPDSYCLGLNYSLSPRVF